MMILNRIKAMLVKEQHTSKWPAEQFGKSKNSAPRWGSNYSNGVQHSFGSLIQLAKMVDLGAHESIISTNKSDE